MTTVPLRRLRPGDGDYPDVLLALGRPPPMTVRGPLDVPTGTGVVAIVGSRWPKPAAIDFARSLAAACAAAGVVVVSGGAVGVDRAAHDGAMAAGGRTWCVLGTGCNHVFPKEHAPLYDAITAANGTLVWPFVPEHPARPGSFKTRNRVLVALAHVVVVVAARLPYSGTLHAACKARELGREVWAVPSGIFDDGEGTDFLIRLRGATPLTDVRAFVERVRGRPASGLRGQPLNDAQQRVLAACEAGPARAEDVMRISGLAPGATTTALLTLVLGGVLVEGSDGCYRVVR